MKISNINNKLYLITRMALTRVSSMLIVFFVAYYGEPEELAVCALILVYLNFVEICSQGGILESFIKNGTSKEIRDIIKSKLFYFMTLLIFLSIVTFSIFFENNQVYILLVFIPIVIANNYKLSVLKYKKNQKIIAKIFALTNLLMIVTFSILIFFLNTIEAFVISQFTNVLAFYKLSNTKLSSIFAHTNAIKSIRGFYTPLIFKVSKFGTLRSAEIFIVLVFGKVALANYVAGSRIFNLVNFFFYGLINETILKEINASDNKLKHLLYTLIISFFLLAPVYLFTFVYSNEILSFIFNTKYPDAAKILMLYSIYGFIQILFLPISQVIILEVSNKITLYYNGLSLLIIAVVYMISLNKDFYDFMNLFIYTQITISILFIIFSIAYLFIKRDIYVN